MDAPMEAPREVLAADSKMKSWSSSGISVHSRVGGGRGGGGGGGGKRLERVGTPPVQLFCVESCGGTPVSSANTHKNSNNQSYVLPTLWLYP